MASSGSIPETINIDGVLVFNILPNADHDTVKINAKEAYEKRLTSIKDANIVKYKITNYKPSSDDLKTLTVFFEKRGTQSGRGKSSYYVHFKTNSEVLLTPQQEEMIRKLSAIDAHAKQEIVFEVTDKIDIAVLNNSFAQYKPEDISATEQALASALGKVESEDEFNKIYRPERYKQQKIKTIYEKIKENNSKEVSTLLKGLTSDKERFDILTANMTAIVVGDVVDPNHENSLLRYAVEEKHAVLAFIFDAFSDDLDYKKKLIEKIFKKTIKSQNVLGIKYVCEAYLRLIEAEAVSREASVFSKAFTTFSKLGCFYYQRSLVQHIRDNLIKDNNPKKLDRAFNILSAYASGDKDLLEKVLKTDIDGKKDKNTTSFKLFDFAHKNLPQDSSSRNRASSNASDTVKF